MKLKPRTGGTSTSPDGHSDESLVNTVSASVMMTRLETKSRVMTSNIWTRAASNGRFDSSMSSVDDSTDKFRASCSICTCSSDVTASSRHARWFGWVSA